MERMNLQKYLMESFNLKENYTEVVEIFRRDCFQICDEIYKAKKFLYRGTDDSTIYYSFPNKVIPRKDRKPKDTARWLHDELDDLFLKKYGWKARSEGVFVTSDPHQADSFGKVCLFFPSDGYKYLWSNSVYDLTCDLSYGAKEIDKPSEVDMLDEWFQIHGPNSKKGVWKSKSQTFVDSDDIEDKFEKDGNNVIDFTWRMSSGLTRAEGNVYYSDANGKRKTLIVRWVPKSGIDFSEYREIVYDEKMTEMQERAYERAVDVVDTYKDNFLRSAMGRSGEIMFSCDFYYVLPRTSWLEDYLRLELMTNHISKQKQMEFKF